MRRRRIAPALALVPLAFASCGRTLTVYERTSPRRVEVDKEAAPARLAATAVRRGDETELRVKRARSVTLTHTLYYNSSALVYDHSMNPANEAAELFVGILMAVVPTGFWQLGERLDGRETPRRKVVRHQRFFLSLFDPTHSVFTSNIRVEPIVREEVFADPPAVRQLEMRLPAQGVAVEYRALDEGEAAVASGSVETDFFGAATLELPAEAVVLEVRAESQTVVIPILEGQVLAAKEAAFAGERGLRKVSEGGEARPGEGAGGGASGAKTPSAPEDEQPSAPLADESPEDPDESSAVELQAPHALPPDPAAVIEIPEVAAVTESSRAEPRSAEDWKRPAPAPTPVPWATWTIDVASLARSESADNPFGQMMLEVRLGHPKLSAAAIFGTGFKSIEDLLYSTVQGGAQLRYYVLGDVGRGLNLGLESLHTSYDDLAEVAPHIELGPIVGYKYTFGVGFCLDVQLGASRLLAPEQVAGDTSVVVNVGVGWSF